MRALFNNGVSLNKVDIAEPQDTATAAESFGNNRFYFIIITIIIYCANTRIKYNNNAAPAAEYIVFCASPGPLLRCRWTVRLFYFSFYSCRDTIIYIYIFVFVKRVMYNIL